MANPAYESHDIAPPLPTVALPSGTDNAYGAMRKSYGTAGRENGKAVSWTENPIHPARDFGDLPDKQAKQDEAKEKVGAMTMQVG